MNRSILFAAFAAATLNAQANPTVEKNGMLVNTEGKTLYIFTKDAPGKSNCNAACAATWPPFTVANPALADADFSIVARDDGSRQWAFKAMPLYLFAADAQPGDAKGEGTGGTWFPVKAQAKSNTIDNANTPKVGDRRLEAY